MLLNLLLVKNEFDKVHHLFKEANQFISLVKRCHMHDVYLPKCWGLD